MKTISVADLKAHLSEYLQRARNGERIVVSARRVPIAELVPVRPAGGLWNRLAREKGVRLGTQSKAPFTPSPTKEPVAWERHLERIQADGE